MSTYRKYVILTIEPLNNNTNAFRLGLMKDDFEQIKNAVLNIKSIEVILNPNEINELVNITLLPTYCNHGKLVNPLINDWIKMNTYHIFEGQNPTKLIFELKITKLKHIYKLYKSHLKC